MDYTKLELNDKNYYCIYDICNRNEVVNMVQCCRKRWQKLETYKPEFMLKHKHDYCLKHLLVVTNINVHASANCYNTKEYYYVLKCNQCDSFIPWMVNGVYHSWIFDIESIDESLPVINANSNQKCPHYSFSKLIDVVINEQK